MATGARQSRRKRAPAAPIVTGVGTASGLHQQEAGGGARRRGGLVAGGGGRELLGDGSRIEQEVLLAVSLRRRNRDFTTKKTRRENQETTRRKLHQRGALRHRWPSRTASSHKQRPSPSNRGRSAHLSPPNRTGLAHCTQCRRSRTTSRLTPSSDCLIWGRTVPHHQAPHHQTWNCQRRSAPEAIAFEKNLAPHFNTHALMIGSNFGFISPKSLVSVDVVTRGVST